MSFKEKKNTVSEYITKKISDLGVKYIFGYQGSNISIFIDTIAHRKDLKYFQTYHEQGSAFAANGYSQSSGLLGVAAVSSGPGALNLITGISNAYCDSIPTLFICGDLSRRYQKGNLTMRQNGFQAIDIVSIVKPITKYAVEITSPDEIQYSLDKAIYEATNGRKGPVLLSIPHWIQRAEFNFKENKDLKISINERVDILPLQKKVQEFINKSKRPLILIGGGLSSKSTQLVLESFLERNPIPVVASLCGLSSLSHEHPCYIGFIGDYGKRYANIALKATDCLLVLGSRLDERQIGFLNENFENKKIIHVDIDESELRDETNNYLPILSNINTFLNSFPSYQNDFKLLNKWRDYLILLKNNKIGSIDNKFTPSFLMNLITKNLNEGSQIFVDVGLHQMCVAQFSEVTNLKKIFFSGGLGSMGYALPASIGGYLANPNLQTIAIVGDGGFMMSLNELQSIARDKLNIKIFIFNNFSLGLVKDYQIKALDGCTIGTVDGYMPGDFQKISSTFSMDYFKLTNIISNEKMKEILFKKGPAIIEVIFQDEMSVYLEQANIPPYDEELQNIINYIV